MNSAEWAAIAGDVARYFWGHENPHMSNSRELRFGAKGARAMSLEAGTWCDWHYAEDDPNFSGGVAALITRETGLAGKALAQWLEEQGFARPDYTPRQKTEQERQEQDRQKAERKAEHQRKADSARDASRRTWLETTILTGPGLLYWHEWRGLTITPPPSIRFHPACWCVEAGERLPALVAGFQTVDGAFAAIHRIWLDPATGNKAALIQPKKSLAPTAGAAIRLAKATHRLAIAEGIETGASVQELSGWPVWVTPTLRPELPPHVRELTIAGDNDDCGTGQGKARRAADHYMRLGLSVRIAIPGAIPGLKKADWNDVLRDMGNDRRAAA